MEWTQDILKRLHGAFVEKYLSMNSQHRTDRANMSAIWNKYLKGYDIRVVRNDNGGSKSKRMFSTNYALQNLIQTINFKNSCVADALIIDNPDRPGQYLLVPREKAELILVLGMM